MGKLYSELVPPLREFIAAQQVFFVATAPSGASGHVNLSPKGLDSFRILGPTRVAYLDCVGSGAETLAHLRENGRICVMFCAFAGPPKIVRLHGTGSVVLRDEPDFVAAVEPFAGAVMVGMRESAVRAVVRVDVHRISDACGHGVPLMDLRAERDVLDSWTANRGPDGLARYHAERNAVSLDGLPGLA